MKQENMEEGADSEGRREQCKMNSNPSFWFSGMVELIPTHPSLALPLRLMLS